MGTGSSKLDTRIPTRPPYVRLGGYEPFACVCKVRGEIAVEERRRQPTEENARAEEDLIFVLTYKRTKPRTIWTKIQFGLEYFFCDLCPTISCPPCPEQIIHKLAFRPPERPTYLLFRFGQYEYRMHLKEASSEFVRLRYRRCQAYTPQLRCFYINTKLAGRIACVYARTFTPSPEVRSLTLLYSHNNGIDLGLCVGYVILMCRRFRVNVFAYDYAGYGQSSGQCSEANLYRSAEAAYDFLITELQISPNEIIAVGTSLGTAAAIHLATTNRILKGVILQGGFLSALRVVCPTRQRTCEMDRFVNVEKIQNVRCPTLVIHGKNDKLFGVQHAEMLRRLCPGAKKIEPLLIDDCGHIDFDEFAVYWQRIHKFLHIELTSANQEGSCCTYNASEIIRRQGSRKKLASLAMDKNLRR